MLVLQVIFWASLAALVWTHALYPLFIAALARLRPRPAHADDSYRPRVALVIAAYNEHDVIAAKLENALALGKGVVHVAHPDDNLPEPRWPVRIHSQHLACEKCGRSFDTLNPHNFSFNSALGWCPACEGLGTQIGADPAALLRDPKLTLAQGALFVWPDVSQAMSQQMLLAFSAQ